MTLKSGKGPRRRGRLSGTVTASALLAMLATGCGGAVVLAGRDDTTPPQFTIEFRDLPAQFEEKLPDPQPAVYTNSMPTRVDTVLGETYTVIAKLEDPESGVQFLELVVSHSEADCLASPTNNTPVATVPNTETSIRRTSGQTDGGTGSTPAAWPTERFVTVSVTVSYRGGCAQGQQMRMASLLHAGGKNGAGMKPKVVAASPVTQPAHSEFGYTIFQGIHPDRPRR